MVDQPGQRLAHPARSLLQRFDRAPVPYLSGGPDQLAEPIGGNLHIGDNDRERIENTFLQVNQHAVSGLSDAPGGDVAPHGADLVGGCARAPRIAEAGTQRARLEDVGAVFAPYLSFGGLQSQPDIVQLASDALGEVKLIGAQLGDGVLIRAVQMIGDALLETVLFGQQRVSQLMRWGGRTGQYLGTAAQKLLLDIVSVIPGQGVAGLTGDVRALMYLDDVAVAEEVRGERPLICASVVA
ncbi:hypothetical protein ACFQX6_66965 [Streptosporangium lutulentum]